MKKWIIYTLFAINLMAVVLLALWTYGWIGDHEKEEIQSRGTPPQVVDIGSGPNTGTGDPLRTAFNKININFSAVYDSLEKWTGLIGPGGSMTWPALAGIPLYAGSQSWGTSITDNSANWNTAYGWGDHSLANYLTSGDIAGKLNISDTASMLTNYALKSELGDLDEQAVTEIVEGVLDDAIQDAVIGVAVEDVLGGTTGRDRYMSPTQIYDYVSTHGGGGSFGGGERIKFTVGATGAPAADDSTFIHSALANKQIDLFRKGVKSEYTYSGDTITVDPDWETAENVEIVLWPSGTWEYLDLDWQTPLFEGLIVYYKMDETTGTSFVDEMGVKNGGSSGMTFGEAGIINYCQYNGSAGYSRIYYDAAVIPTAEFSVSFWLNLEALPSEEDRDYTVLNMPRASVPYAPHLIQIRKSDNKMMFRLTNDSQITFSVYSTDALEVDTWYHIVAVHNGAGEALQLYINGEDVSDNAGIFTGSLYPITSSGINLMNSYSGGTANVVGYMDEFMLYHISLDETKVKTLYNNGNGVQLTIP